VRALVAVAEAAEGAADRLEGVFRATGAILVRVQPERQLPAEGWKRVVKG
jgi:hypothetical protein